MLEDILFLKEPSLSFKAIKLFLTVSLSLSYLFLSVIKVFLLLKAIKLSLILNIEALVDLIFSSIFKSLTFIFSASVSSLVELACNLDNFSSNLSLALESFSTLVLKTVISLAIKAISTLSSSLVTSLYSRAFLAASSSGTKFSLFSFIIKFIHI